jgi:hypothetical protein
MYGRDGRLGGDESWQMRQRMIFRFPDAGEQPSLAPASQLEGSGAMSMPAGLSFPTNFAYPDLLSHAADNAADCSLHRPMASVKGLA